MSEMVVSSPPQGTEQDVCGSCSQAVLAATTPSGRRLLLDLEPHQDGTIELRRTGSLWFAEPLEQTECLFEVDWPRWVPHRTSCRTASTSRRGRIPRQRRG